jgi:hypothetical protein
MKIEYLHASKSGNGATVAEEFKRQMAAKGVTVNVRHSGKPRRRSSRRLTCTSSARRVARANRSDGCAAS